MFDRIERMILSRMTAGRLSKTRIEIPECRYKADLEQHDRYLGFSSELLRMALAGIAALGIVVGWLFDGGTVRNALKSPYVIAPTTRAITFLTIAAAAALVHRFFASDGMYYHFRAIKLLILSERNEKLTETSESSSSNVGDTGLAAELDEKRRNLRFRVAGWFLCLSALALIAGIVELGIAIRQILTTAA